VRISDGVVVALTIVLSIVRGVGTIPRRCVVGTGKNTVVTVLVENVSHEEFAAVWIFLGRKPLLYIKCSLSIASGGTDRGVVWLRLRECLHSHISRWSIDGTSTKVDRSSKTIDGSRFGSLIDIGASDDDMELILPLSSVSSRRCT